MDKVLRKRNKRQRCGDEALEKTNKKIITKRIKRNNPGFLKKIDALKTEEVKCEMCHYAYKRYCRFYKHICKEDPCNICEKMLVTEEKLNSHECVHVKKDGDLEDSNNNKPNFSNLFGNQSSELKHESNCVKSKMKITNKNPKKCKLCETLITGTIDHCSCIKAFYCKKCAIFSRVPESKCFSKSRLDSEALKLEENKMRVDTENIASETIKNKNEIVVETNENKSSIVTDKSENKNKLITEKIKNKNNSKIVTRKRNLASEELVKENVVAKKLAKETVSLKRLRKTKASSDKTTITSLNNPKTKVASVQSDETSTINNDKSYVSSIENIVAAVIPETNSPFVRTEYVSDDASDILLRQKYKKHESFASSKTLLKQDSVKNSLLSTGLNENNKLRKRVFKHNQKKALLKNSAIPLKEKKLSDRRPTKKIHNETVFKLERVLSDATTGVLLKHSAGNVYYQCVRCNEEIATVSLGINHFLNCNKKVDKNSTVTESNSVWICIPCRKIVDSYPGLLKHKMSCSEILIQKSVNDSPPVKVSKINEVGHCRKCGYSCLSPAIFVKHSCEDRLKKMKNCVVDLNFVPNIDSETIDKMIYYHCSVCNKDFLDSDIFQLHMQHKHPAQYNGSVTPSSVNINKPVTIKVEPDEPSPIQDKMYNDLCEFTVENVFKNLVGVFQIVDEMEEESQSSDDPLHSDAVSNHEESNSEIDTLTTNLSGDNGGENQLNNHSSPLDEVPNCVEKKSENSEGSCSNDQSSSSMSKSDDGLIQSDSLTEKYKETVLHLNEGSLNFSWNHSIRDISAYANVSHTSIEYVCKICYEDMPKEDLHRHFRYEHEMRNSVLNILYVITS